jgi:hypothetical protein
MVGYETISNLQNSAMEKKVELILGDSQKRM